ncbi:hypothetical protein [Tenacibaculum halocynthiae]|uniref:hypothetical protein n=1 Tax=Tenacibaculum halocynthiae TaxID=1254437 RepID=UPI003892E0CB
MKTKSIVVVIIMMIMSLVGNAQNKIEATGNVGVGTTIPGQKLHIEGGHGDSRILLHSRGGGTESKFADLMLWASEPGLTYTGVGIGNNITNATTTPFLRRISNQRGGSYIRFLDAQIMMNVIKNNGETINAFNISNLGNVGLGTTSPKSRLDLGKNYSNPSIYPNKITLWSGGENNYFGFGISTGDLDYFSQSNHRFYTGYNGTPGTEKMVIQSNGNVGIGTTNPGSWRLAVNGQIRAKEIKVETGWSDFVFYDNYKLPTLQEVENHIKEKGHLKDIPSAKEVEENGIFLGEMDSKLLQKIEELTLYTIEQEKKLKSQEDKINVLEKQNSKIDKQQKEIEEQEKKIKRLDSLVQKLLKNKN